MVIRYDAGLSTGYGVLEKTNLSSIAITGQQPMNPQLYGALVGHHILKTGRTTGTTQGVVRYLCVDSNTIQYPSIWTLCSDVADYASDYGDSGSPVYVQYDPTVTNTPRAVGIHWGSGSGLSYYSPPQQIWAALAYQFYF